MFDGEKKRKFLRIAEILALLAWIFGSVVILCVLGLVYARDYKNNNSLASRSTVHHITQSNGYWTGWDSFYEPDSSATPEERGYQYYSYYTVADTFAYGGRDLSSLTTLFDYDPNDPVLLRLFLEI